MSDAKFAHVRAIDGLRAVAVTSVVLCHLNRNLLPGGFVGVDIFFVISGFVVTGSLMGVHFDRLRDLLVYFYARRLRRIVPALVVMLLVVTTLYVLFIPTAWLSASVSRVALAAFLGLSNVQLARLTETYFSTASDYNPFVHTWTLGVEEQFYLVFPFLMFWYQRQRGAQANETGAIVLIAITSATSLLVCATLTPLSPQYAFYSIFARFWELGAGMMLCLSMPRWQGRVATLPTWLAKSAMTVSAALVLVTFAIPQSAYFPFPLVLFPVTGTLGMIALLCARRSGWVDALLESRPAVGIGLISYSVYLWHWPVFVLFRWSVGLDGIARPVVAVVLAFALGTLSYLLVEQPLRRSRFVVRARRGHVVLAGLAAMLIGCGMSTVALLNKPRLSLSATAQRTLWYAEDVPGLGETGGCSIRETVVSIGDGTRNFWLPQNCAKRITERRLIVIGDSHALVYIPAIRRLVAEQGIEAQLYFKSGCGFVGLSGTMAQAVPCAAYQDATTESLLQDVRSGDVVFLPSLRLNRLSLQTGETVTISDPTSLLLRPATARAATVAEARIVFEQFERRGATVLLEAPPPVLPGAPFRCADWYNRGNQACARLSIARAEMETMRAPVLAAMQQLVGTSPRIRIWDPLPALCGPDRCEGITPQGPLFFDGDHLSGYASKVLYPGLRAAIMEPDSQPLQTASR